MVFCDLERDKMQAILEKCVGEFITSIKSFEKDFEFVYTAIDALNDASYGFTQYLLINLAL